MKYRHFRSFLCILFATIQVSYFLSSCDERNKQGHQEKQSENGHYYRDLFGQNYYATGSFIVKKDSVEDNLWLYANLESPLVIYGNFLHGSPIGEWKFGLKDSAIISSYWTIYQNNSTKCKFSLPLAYRETQVDSNYFKLETFNDTLGKISIIVGVRQHVIRDADLTKFGTYSEKGLSEQGYSFRGQTKEINQKGQRYFVSEYNLKDSAGVDAKLYNIYGYCPSQKHFIELTVFHKGQKENLVKIIFNLIATNLYVENERFINPYVQ